MNSVQEQTKQNKKRRSEEMNLWKQHFGEDVNRSEFCVEEQRGSRRVTEQRQVHLLPLLSSLSLFLTHIIRISDLKICGWIHLTSKWFMCCKAKHLNQ
ncbi:hypothetical protein HYC85_010275 [Camellia sinensis]|uniref:Uncharacterized protein n=1 Tax=Camellia sinensis TaxID=4442 RepID=A0A7J7HJC4_CAMSI|nr:hypothetical protein HYC85_010275 [Camellia sinensis]